VHAAAAAVLLHPDPDHDDDDDQDDASIVTSMMPMASVVSPKAAAITPLKFV
jgi:hypothetical protein